LVPSLTKTSAAAALAASRHRMAAPVLAPTVNLQVIDVTAVSVERDLYWPATDLAILDINLRTLGSIDENCERFRAKRTLDASLGQAAIYSCIHRVFLIAVFSSPTS